MARKVDINIVIDTITTSSVSSKLQLHGHSSYIIMTQHTLVQKHGSGDLAIMIDESPLHAY